MNMVVLSVLRCAQTNSAAKISPCVIHMNLTSGTFLFINRQCKTAKVTTVQTLAKRHLAAHYLCSGQPLTEFRIKLFF